MGKTCPYMKRYRQFNYLVCSLQEESGIDYTNSHNAIKAICLYQKFCIDQGKYLNSNDFSSKCKWYLRGDKKP